MGTAEFVEGIGGMGGGEHGGPPIALSRLIGIPPINGEFGAH